MDPISMMAFSLIVSWVVVNAAWKAGVDQTKAEARHAAEAIRKDLRDRRKSWAKQLERRLADGRKGGPATALWWGWAAMRTAKGLRRVMRREPRTAEKAIGGKTGPFGRIFGAAWRGAQYARGEARRQRAAQEKVHASPVGVCGRCGAVAAKSALVWALTRFGRQEQMCAKCRADVEAARKADQEASRAAKDEPAQDPIDAEPGVVHDSDEYTVPGSAGGASATPPPSGAWVPPRHQQQTTTPPPSKPAPATVKVERIHETPKAQPSLSAGEPAAVNATPEGEEMPRQLTPARGGALATRNAAMTRRGGGDSYTHGQWHRATNDIHRRLAMLPALLEAMLRSLNHESAGRSQVAGVMAIYEGTVLFMGELQDMLRVVGAKERPMVDAVTTAGGPDEIPNLGYFREI